VVLCTVKNLLTFLLVLLSFDLPLTYMLRGHVFSLNIGISPYFRIKNSCHFFNYISYLPTYIHTYILQQSASTRGVQPSDSLLLLGAVTESAQGVTEALYKID
jgi:hypothetical protein